MCEGKVLMDERFNMRKPLITTLKSNTVIIQVSHDKVSVKLGMVG